MDESSKLIEEIRQIKVQYRAEVNGVRKQWPRAIKTRIIQLCESGLRSQEIADKTGISFHTVSAWKSKHKNKELFHQLPVVLGNTKKPVSKKSATVTVTKTGESILSTKSVTVTVTTPGGYKIEGLTAEQLAVFFRKIGAG
jgi:transposase-like protein